MLGSYVLAPFPKPLEATAALQKSGLVAYAVPQLQRFTLVNLCHQLDRELVQCHREATSAAGLGDCVP